MIRNFVIVIFFCLLTSTWVQAESYIRDYYYIASEADSKITSRTNALDQVKLVLLQEVGTHIRQEINISKDGFGNIHATEDIDAFTAGFTRVKIIEENWNGETYYVKAEIEVDVDSVRKSLESIRGDKSEENKKNLKKLKETQRLLSESREDIANLKAQLIQANQSQKEIILTQYDDKLRKFSSLEMMEKGDGFLSQGLYEEAVYWFRNAAEIGLPSSQSSLGFMYHEGRGVKQSDEKAEFWSRKAAEQGDSLGQYLLGSFYLKGKVVKQNDKIAFEWFEKAAKQGNQFGQTNFGFMHQEGRGVKQSDEKAEFWYRKAAEQGDSWGQLKLGMLYFFGDGLEKNIFEAEKWIRKSAEGNNSSGQFALGLLYQKGIGVNQSDDKAANWFRKACDNGSDKACKKE